MCGFLYFLLIYLKKNCVTLLQTLIICGPPDISLCNKDRDRFFPPSLSSSFNVIIIFRLSFRIKKTCVIIPIPNFFFAEYDDRLIDTKIKKDKKKNG